MSQDTEVTKKESVEDRERRLMYESFCFVCTLTTHRTCAFCQFNVGLAAKMLPENAGKFIE